MTSQRRPDELIRILRTDFAGSPGSPGGGGGGGLFPQFVVSHSHQNVTDGTHNANWSGPSILLADTKRINCYGRFIIPSTFSGETITIEHVISSNSPGANQNVYLYADANYGGCDEALVHWDPQNPPGNYVEYNMTGYVNPRRICIMSYSLTVPSIGDVIDLWFERNAPNALDTWDGKTIRFWGWKITWA